MRHSKSLLYYGYFSTRVIDDATERFIVEKTDSQVPQKSVMLRLIFCFVNAFLFATRGQLVLSDSDRAAFVAEKHCLHNENKASRMSAFMRHSAILAYQKKSHLFLLLSLPEKTDTQPRKRCRCNNQNRQHGEWTDICAD